jgi:hypothetical protein
LDAINNPIESIFGDTINKYGGFGPWVFLHILHPFSMSPAFVAKYKIKMQPVVKGGWRKKGK